jgi:hypothetical protein
MSKCTGSPAEVLALPYVEGNLPEAEAERFEEHYFDCPVCLDYLQTIQAMGAGMARVPAPAFAKPQPGRLLAWPVMTWAIGSAAALLLLTGITYRLVAHRDAGPTTARTAPAPAPAPAVQPAATLGKQPPAADATLLADLELPAYAAANLRGDSEDANFTAGMKAYSRSNCAAAMPALARVAADSPDSRAAKFYRGVCQMHAGDLSAAAATLRPVADAGDSPQQESAYYYLAQVALKRNDPGTAHKLLFETIALKGDLEWQAGVEDRKVLDLVKAEREAPVYSPKSK